MNFDELALKDKASSNYISAGYAACLTPASSSSNPNPNGRGVVKLVEGKNLTKGE